MPQHHCFDASEIMLARIKLSWFVNQLAEETADEFGIRWRTSPHTPSTLEDLTAEFRSCQLSGLPLRVSSRHSENTIYVTAADCAAFRFVHDSRHVFLQAGFDVEPELLVSACHLARLHRAGFAADSIEARLLYADTAGQTHFASKTGAFPLNQLRFALRCLTVSLDRAIADERSAELDHHDAA